MLDGVRWIEECLTKLPPRERVLKLEKSYIIFDTSSRRGVVRLQYNSAPPDTVICCNVFDSTRNGKDICKHVYDLLAPDGIIIIVCTNVHPGILRFYLRQFDWKYITTIPEVSETYAIAGKGTRPLGIK